MKKKDYCNYEGHEGLRDAMRIVLTAYGSAERFFAAIKEITYADFGMAALTEYIHSLEHLQPEYVDRFKDILAQKGLPVEYPAIAELAEDLYDLDKIFECCVQIIDETDAALEQFIAYIEAREPEMHALAREAETLQCENSADRRFLLDAWAMWDNGGASLASYDGWVKDHAPALKK